MQECCSPYYSLEGAAMMPQRQHNLCDTAYWDFLLHFSTEYSNIMPQIYVYMIHSFYVGRGAAQGKIAHSLVSEMIYARSEPAP